MGATHGFSPVEEKIPWFLLSPFKTCLFIRAFSYPFLAFSLSLIFSHSKQAILVSWLTKMVFLVV
jgi:hypothetical protein